MRHTLYRLSRALTLVTIVLMTRAAEADPLCTLFGRCYYESLGFRIAVVDKSTGQALADVHALAEWQSYAAGRRNGPIMVQDETSGADGLLSFPAWGPIRGFREGLVLNSDPVITLFKPAYQPLEIYNAYPTGPHETDRVHGLGQDGKRFELEPFRGNSEQWVGALERIWRGRAFSRGPEQEAQFRQPYLNRLRRVWAERDKVPETYRTRPGFFWSVEEQLKAMETANR